MVALKVVNDETTDAVAKSVSEIDPVTVARWLENRQVLLIDVRETAEYEYEHVPGSVLMPLSFLAPEVFPPLPGIRVVVMCAVGKRSAAAIKQLAEEGLTGALNMTGGLAAWNAAGLETQGGKHEAADYQI